MTRSSRIIEQLHGLGTIKGSGIEPLPASYELTIRRRYLRSEAFGRSVSVAPGLCDVSGSVKLEGELPLRQWLGLENVEDLVLILEDGRRFGFSFEGHRVPGSWCTISLRDEMTLLDGIAVNG